MKGLTADRLVPAGNRRPLRRNPLDPPYSKGEMKGLTADR